MIAVYPIGSTINYPEKTFDVYTLLNFLHEPDIILLDMNGKLVNTWNSKVTRKDELKNRWRFFHEQGCRIATTTHKNRCFPGTETAGS